MQQDRTLKRLPPDFECDNPALLKETITATRALGELKGVTATIPNENILLDTLIISEAQSSSAIENIITTQSELFIANIIDSLMFCEVRVARCEAVM